MGLLALLTACAAVAAAEDVPTPDEKSVLDAVWGVLDSDAELANLHRGFVTHLQANRSLGEALEGLWTLGRHPVIGNLMAAFEESLARDPDLNTLFFSFYGALGSKSYLRDPVASLYDAELDKPEFEESFNELRADVARAWAFLRNPAKPSSPRLYGLRAAFKRDPQLRVDLLEAYGRLRQSGSAHGSIFPFWAKACNTGDGAGEAYRRLFSALAAEPDLFWTWHKAQIELARDPHVAKWILYWQRRVRRHPVLADKYGMYLKALDRLPGYGKAAMDALEVKLGSPSAWPPKENPPVIEGPPPARGGFYHRPLKSDLMPFIPERPLNDKPMPKMPTMPVMPERPPAPEKPSVTQNGRL